MATCCPNSRITGVIQRLELAMWSKRFFYGTAFRIKAISEIERECHSGLLKKRIGSISDDSFGYALNALDINSLQDGWDMMNKKMKRNGMIRNSPFNGWIVGVFDGIETLKSYSRCCETCCERTITFKTNTVKTQYYHRVVVLSLFGYRFPIPIGLEMMKKEEGEVDCALRLLKRVTENPGVRFLDMVIGDALHCTPRFFKTCRQFVLWHFFSQCSFSTITFWPVEKQNMCLLSILRKNSINPQQSIGMTLGDANYCVK